jgi:hypothetical protein
LLYKFQGPDGYYPEFLSIGGSGNLYGMTPYGGTGTACSGLGCGVIFQLVSSSGGWSEEVLYSFAGPPSDGAFPNPFVIDSEGNVLGTTSQGGSTNGGIAYELSQSSAGGWSETRLHSFGGTAGENPMSTFVIDSTGSLYSTATSGGKFGYGLVFKLSPF